MPLDRQSFLNLAASPASFAREAVSIPGLGDVFVRVLTLAESEALLAAKNAGTNLQFVARLVASSVCDDQGVRLLTDADADHLAQLPYALLEPIVDAALRLNKWGASNDRADVRKNSESATPTG